MEARVRCALSAAMRHFCSDASVDATLTIAAKTKLGFRCTYTHTHMHAHTCRAVAATVLHLRREREARDCATAITRKHSLRRLPPALPLSAHTLSLSKGTGNHFYMPVCLYVCASVTAMGNANGNGNANANGNGQINQLGASQRPLAAVRVTSFISASRLHQLAQGKQQEQQQQQAGWTCD